MRAYEQIRINLALSAQHRDINVNLIGVGGGVSYDVSGPTHHCLEDLTIIRALPNVILFSPSDALMAEKFIDFSIRVKQPKYIRLDGKPLPAIYDKGKNFEWQKGACELLKGDKVCMVTTGFMTHKALKIARKLQESNVKAGLVDVFLLKPVNDDFIFNILKKYKRIITIEEAFINKGGLDSLILNILNSRNARIELKNFGFRDEYIFKLGNRDFLSGLSHFADNDIIGAINE